MPERVLPVLEELVRSTGFTVHLAVADEGQALYVQKVAPPGMVLDTFVGKHANLHCTAVGKVILAYSDETFINQFLSKTSFTRHTPNTIVSADMLRKQLTAVRRNGYATDDEEEELGTRCVAV